MRPVSPGEVLREQLEELGMSANALAAALHVPTNRVTGILNGTRALTPETALRLERYFSGTTAQFWLNLQTSFDLRRAEIDGVKALSEIRPLKAS
jgi:addiction module HigA family antidote